MSDDEDLINILPIGAKFSLASLDRKDPEAAAAALTEKGQEAAKMLAGAPSDVAAGKQAGAGNAMLFHTWDKKAKD